MKLKLIQPQSLPCTYCGARPGEPCIVTLYPEAGPLSIKWNHGARQEAAA